jgi:uncharacterized membrane protein YfcA
MIVYITKFIHILIALGLLGITVYCVTYLRSVNTKKTVQLNKIILILSALALVTGTLLVHPKHYTFHTHWIQAAYLLLAIFCIGIISLLYFKRYLKSAWQTRLIYLFLTMILVFITHDAVTKTTFVF